MVLNSVLYNGVEYERQRGLLVGIGVSTAVNGSGSLRQESAKRGTDEDIAVVYSKGGGSGDEFYGKVVYTPPNTYFGYKIGGWTSIAASGSMSLGISGSNATRNSGGLGSILGNGSGSLPSGCVTLYRSDISWNGYYTPKVTSGGSITLKGNSEASRKECSSASITPGYSDNFVLGDRGYSGGISASVSPVRTGGCYTTPRINGGASSTPKPSGSSTLTEVKTITSNMSKEDFVAAVFAAAKEVEKKTGIPAAIITAQAILESNYGKSVPVDKKTGQYSYNLFGIKGEGPAGSVTVTTTEYVNGKKIKIEDRFRAYNNFEESIKDHSEFLRNNKRYQELFKTSDPIKWAEGLQKAGYATDPEYSKKLINIMTTWKLIDTKEKKK